MSNLAPAQPPNPPPTNLYKILPSPPPCPLPTAELPLSDLDAKDGYIHLSTAEQVPGTCARFFADYKKLWILRLRYEDLLAGRDGFAGSDISCGGGGKEAEAGEAEGMGRCGVGLLKWEEVPGKGAFAHYFGAGIGCGNVVDVVEVSRKDDEGWEGNVKLEW